MKIKFLIQGESNPANIYIFLSAGLRKEFKRKTGKRIDPKFWKADNKDSVNRFGTPIGKDDTRNNLITDLEELSTFIKKAFNTDEPKGIEITGDWLQSQIDLFHGKSKVVDLDIFLNYIQK